MFGAAASPLPQAFIYLFLGFCRVLDVGPSRLLTLLLDLFAGGVLS